MEIEGLRFSMGHCSWPWIDECIAMYGKFLNSSSYRRNTAEMFFDTTPGTPEIYREELLTKLYSVGYNVGNNIMFGTDASADNYNSEWASLWIEKDAEIMKKLGVSKHNLMYSDNLMRFLGKTKNRSEQNIVKFDSFQRWSPVNSDVKEIIIKWYLKLGFSKKYDEEFYEALEQIKVSDIISADTYNKKEKDGKRNLLSHLYMCEELSKKYSEKGISEEILLDTLKDIVIWTDTWSDIDGKLCLKQLAWLSGHMTMKLFKIGRLQFRMNVAAYEVPEKGIKKGDNIIEIHIPEGEPLNVDKCKESIKLASEFFAKYFPEFKYEYFSTYTWLLDKTLKEFLPQESNILKFQQIFDIVPGSEIKSDSILNYVFKKNADRKDVKNSVCTSSLAKKVKEHVLADGDFFVTLGTVKKYL